MHHSFAHCVLYQKTHIAIRFAAIPFRSNKIRMTEQPNVFHSYIERIAHAHFHLKSIHTICAHGMKPFFV